MGWLTGALASQGAQVSRKSRLSSIGGTRRKRRLAAVGGVAAVLYAGLWVRNEYFPSTLEGTRHVTVTATPIAFDPGRPGQVRFGHMRWVGGLKLTADSGHFGGYSGLALDKEGKRLFAISDTGTWLSGELVFRNGRLAGVANARIGPILDRKGKPLHRKKYRDSEGLTALNPGQDDGEWLVSFERVHRIVRYRFANDELVFQGTVKIPEEARGLSRNAGLEGITVLRAGEDKGAVLAFAEYKRDQDERAPGWLMKNGAASKLWMKVPDQFGVTDLASLANGDVLALERRFLNPFDGLRMRLVRISAADIRAGAVIEPEVLLETDHRTNIDNMEGLAVTERPDGEVIVTMISDDNFMPVQQTVLLQFALDRSGN